MSSSLQRRTYVVAVVALLLTVTTLYFFRPSNRAELGSPLNGGFDQEDQDDSASTLPDGELNIITKNAAVIIEDRSVDKLVPLLLHFSSVLGADWPIILFTSQHTTPISAPFRRAIAERRLSVRLLPPEINFSNQRQVSQFLTEPWLWEQLAPADHVLLFQSDSILCSGSPLRVEDFLEYDFVGAPIDVSLNHGEGFNGGLSLRNRQMILDIIESSDWKSEYDDAENKKDPSVEFEDQWFYKKMNELPNLPNGEPGARLPSIEVAQTFSVETMWYDNPLGYHQVERWQPHRLNEVDQWCPERRLASTDLLVFKGNPLNGGLQRK